MKKLNLNGWRIFSLDVISLFASVQTIEKIEYLCDYIENGGVVANLPIEDLKQLLFFVHAMYSLNLTVRFVAQRMM